METNGSDHTTRYSRHMASRRLMLEPSFSRHPQTNANVSAKALCGKPKPRCSKTILHTTHTTQHRLAIVTTTPVPMTRLAIKSHIPHREVINAIEAGLQSAHRRQVDRANARNGDSRARDNGFAIGNDTRRHKHLHARGGWKSGHEIEVPNEGPVTRLIECVAFGDWQSSLK